MCLLCLLWFLCSAPDLLHAELRRVEVRRQDDFGTYERTIGRAFFSVDPRLPANQHIADVAFAPKNAGGQVEFSGDLLYFGSSPAKITHTGIYMGQGRFINATTHETPMVRIDDLNDPYWTKLLVAMRRLK